MEELIIVVQCHIVKERCPGYYCEHAFTTRSCGFAEYAKNLTVRFLPLTCGGCCGRATHRKIASALKHIKKKEKVNKDKIVVHLSSCITNDSYHGPPCPHIDYLKTMIVDKLGLAMKETTYTC